MRAMRGLLVSSVVMMVACSGPASEPEPAAGISASAGDEEGEAGATPEPLPRARALARYGCDDDGRWSLTYVIDEHERTCEDELTSAPLVIVQRPGEGAGPQVFEFELGSDRGEGAICRAPEPCPDADHTFTIVDGDPPHVEWSLSLADESVDHGSAPVLTCNEAPPPPCTL